MTKLTLCQLCRREPRRTRRKVFGAEIRISQTSFPIWQVDPGFLARFLNFSRAHFLPSNRTRPKSELQSRITYRTLKREKSCRIYVRAKSEFTCEPLVGCIQEPLCAIVIHALMQISPGTFLWSRVALDMFLLGRSYRCRESTIFALPPKLIWRRVSFFDAYFS